MPPFARLFQLLRRDTDILWTALVVGIAASLLTLAVPFAVQLLIDTVANTGSTVAVFWLSLSLLTFLIAYGLLASVQAWLLEMLERRLVANLSADVTFRMLESDVAALEARDSADLLNRYNEIETLKTHVPILLTAGLNLVLQTLIGYLVVSFYHPYFLLLSLLHGAFVLLIWRSVDPGAVRTAIRLSGTRYSIAAWMETLARRRRFFALGPARAWAIDASSRLATDYIDAHQAHFRRSYFQTVAYQALMASSAVALFGIGGWLVVIGQLTLGQLVAAELILGAIFLNTGAFATVLESWYALVSGADKLGAVRDVALRADVERDVGASLGAIVMEGVRVRWRDRELRFDVRIAPTGRTVLWGEDLALEAALVDLLQGVRAPDGGVLRIDGAPDSGLADSLFVVDGAAPPDVLLGDYLRAVAPEAEDGELATALGVAGAPHLRSLLGAHLLAVNPALTLQERVQINLAQGLLSGARLLLLTRESELLPTAVFTALSAALGADRGMVLSCDTPPDLPFDGWITIENGVARTVTSAEVRASEPPAEFEDDRTEFGP